jgi:hypothetical protein
VDSLEFINEFVSNITPESKPVIEMIANDLIGAFTKVLNETFNKNTDLINIRFVNYLAAILNKISSCREIMIQVNEE